jgi:hypothetical protein
MAFPIPNTLRHSDENPAKLDFIGATTRYDQPVHSCKVPRRLDPWVMSVRSAGENLRLRWVAETSRTIR